MTTQGATTWPQDGNCGACGRPARAFPSGNWEHVGRPCSARSQTLWHVDDCAVRLAIVFVPAGQPLPAEPGRPHFHAIATDARGIPAALGWCTTDHTESVREVLAREAEQVPA